MGKADRLRALRRVPAAGILLVASLASCDGGGTLRSPDVPVTMGLTTRTTGLLLPNEIAEGLQLLPGDDGTLPVRARWVALGDVPEAFAVDSQVVYFVDGDVTALNLRDGSVAWKYTEREGLHSDGGVVIGLEGSSVVRVHSPSEYDLRLDRQRGRLLARGSGYEELGPGFAPLSSPPPSRFAVEVDLQGAVGRWPDGRVAWRLVVESPFVDEKAAVEADNAIVLMTSGQHLVVLDMIP